MVCVTCNIPITVVQFGPNELEAQNVDAVFVHITALPWGVWAHQENVSSAQSAQVTQAHQTNSKPYTAKTH